jgi:ABC-2 type transport system ATP-binding protein
MISIECVTKKYGAFTAVECLNLKIKKGEIFGFLGPNGAGKTTTIKMMCGLIAITEGDIFIDGLSIVKNPVEYKRKFAFIPDKPFMFEKLRGIEYVEFIANVYGVEKARYKKQLARYAETFGVSSYINDFIESYSHGMSQKLLLTASLIHSPEVFILDEPMVGLDPKSMRVLKEELKRLSKEGTTVFMSTHTIDTAEEVCSNVGIIDRGHLIDTGKMAALKKRNKQKKLEDIFFKLTEEEND